jgi:methylenetetrahydrofolate dehydrogenase (NADP+) / methenyltetrahydrofolate cyclohydrolase
METTILNGNLFKETIFIQMKEQISELKAKTGIAPGIAFIAMVGHEPLMKYTIGLHEMEAKALGFNVVMEIRGQEVEEDELFEIVDRLNYNDDIHAIVLLQPVPEHLDAMRIISRIRPEKEVEGFHPENIIGLITNDKAKSKYPMVLPTSLIELFNLYDVKVKANSEWVFVVDDEFFSRTFTNMIVKTACVRVVPYDCSVTIVNRNSLKLPEHCKRADFLVIISRHPEYLNPEWVKPGVCIVDVYSNLVKEIPNKNNPGCLIPIIRGGVNANAFIDIAGAIAPCPGGLMPLVLANLFRNTITSFINTSVEEHEYERV